MPRLNPSVKRSEFTIRNLLPDDQRQFVVQLQGTIDLSDLDDLPTVKFLTVDEYETCNQDPLLQFINRRNVIEQEEFTTEEAKEILNRSNYDGGFIIDYLANFGLIVVDRDSRSAVAL